MEQEKDYCPSCMKQSKRVEFCSWCGSRELTFKMDMRDSNSDSLGDKATDLDQAGIEQVTPLEKNYCLSCMKRSKKVEFCSWCGSRELSSESDVSDLINKWEGKSKRLQEMKLYTVDSLVSKKVVEELGLVYGSSSKHALLLQKQSERLTSAYEVAVMNLKVEAAELGADAVIGVRFALNNSEGASSTFFGSSEAIVIIGTAVRLEESN